MINPIYIPTPLVTISSGYIGTPDAWRQMWLQFLDMDKSNCIGSFFSEAERLVIKSKILKLIDQVAYSQERYLNELEGFRKKVGANIPSSFRDFWLSGSHEIVEVLWYHFCGFGKDPSAEIYNRYKNKFSNPEDLVSVKNHEGEVVSDLVGSILDIFSDGFSAKAMKNYYSYGVKQDSYGPPAVNKYYFENSFVFAEGEVDVDGGVILLSILQRTKDSDFEVSFVSDSESTVDRFRSIAELVFRRVVFTLYFSSGTHYVVGENPAADEVASLLLDLNILANQTEPNWSEWEAIKYDLLK